MTEPASYHCPACVTVLPADRPRWRCDCGSHLNPGPRTGLFPYAIATYAAAAVLPCRIYVPATAPRANVVQIATSGAEVCAIPGTRQAVTDAALAAAASGDSFYASHNWQPFFIEGTKTLAFEIWEQLGFRVPDNVLVPTGYGSNILGLERGFDELEQRGEITN